MSKTQEDWEHLAFALDDEGLDYTILKKLGRSWFEETDAEEAVRAYCDSVDALKEKLREIFADADITCEYVED
jgi:hypothetical protein